MMTSKSYNFAAKFEKFRISLLYQYFKYLKIMGKVMRNLFLFSTGAIFVRDSERYIDDDLKDFYDFINKDKSRLTGCAEDRENMHKDVQNLRKSFKKSVKEAMESFAS